MISNPSPKAPRLRFFLAVCAASTLCTAVVACSSSKPSTPAPAKQPTVAASLPAPALAQSSTADTGASAGVAGGGKACGLLTVDEVAKATAMPMTVRGDADGICAYSATADPSQLVYVQIFPDTQSMVTPKGMETGSQHLTGLGDDAFFATAGIVFVQKGSRGFSITMPSLTVAGLEAPPQILTLAHAALTRF